MPDPSLGLEARCHECGGDNWRTQHTRLCEPVTDLGPDNGEPVREIELICTLCHRRKWMPIGSP